MSDAMRPAKNELPYMPVIVADERAIAGDMSNEELGVYWRIKLALWDANGFLAEDKLMRTARAGKRWGAIARTVMDYVTVAGGLFSMGSVLLALEAVRKRRADRVEHALKAAAARWEVARLKNSGKAVSGVLATQISDALLKSHKSLKQQEPQMLGASFEQCPKMPNQNQNDLDNRITSYASDATAGLSEKRMPAGIVLDPEQHALVFQHGTALVTQRVGLKKLSARSRVARWLERIGDADKLIVLLGMAEEDASLREDDFIEFVEEQVAEFEGAAQGEQRAAPAPPTPVVPEPLDEPAPADVSCPQGGGQVADPKAVAELWMRTDGRRAIIERTGEHPGVIDSRLERWLRKADADPLVLRDVVLSAFARSVHGGRLCELIEDGLWLHQKRKDGPQLPLKVPLQGGLPPREARLAAPVPGTAGDGDKEPALPSERKMA